MAKYLYSYFEERGNFHAQVDDKDGKTIWEVHYPDFYEDEETGEVVESSTIFDDGFMRNVDDVDGLEDYLKEMQLIGDEDELVTSFDDLDEDDEQEYMARGGKTKTNTQAVKNLVKNLENTPHSIGLAILRERLLTYAEQDQQSMKENPQAWSNPFLSAGMYEDYLNRVIKYLNFDNKGTNTQVIKKLVKDLDNTPHSIGLAILRERLLTHSEIDLQTLKDNPEAWNNPFLSSDMYEDYFNRVMKELEFEYESGGYMAKGGEVLDDVEMYVKIHGYYPESVMVMRGDGMGKSIVRNPNHKFELDADDSRTAEEMGYEYDYYVHGWVEKEDDDDYAKGGNVPTLEKRVAEVNAMINKGNELGVEVVDKSVTWQSPMKFKPIRYSNGTLYVEYEEFDLYGYGTKGSRSWDTKKETITKTKDGVEAQREFLTDVARMYRSAIKHHEKYGYEAGGYMARGGEVRYKLKGTNFGQQIESGQKFKALITKVFESQSGEHQYPLNFISETAYTGKVVKHEGSYYLKDYMYNGTLSKFEFLDDPNFLEALKYLDRPAIRKFDEGGENDPISVARTKAAEEMDWYSEAVKVYGNDFTDLSANEKEEVMEDLKRDWYRNTHFASGGVTKYYDEQQTYRLTPSNSIERELMAKVNVNNDAFVGNFGWKTPQGRTADGYLYKLDDYLDDYIKELLSEIRLKDGEKVFRYINRTTAISGSKPLIKINIDKGLIYFLENNENDDIVFEKRGVKAMWINLIKGKFEAGGDIDMRMLDPMQRIDNPNFDDVSMYSKGGLTKEETKKVAQKFATALTKAEGIKFSVASDSLEEDSFDLDRDGEKYAGGSYNIYSNGDVKNVAISGNPVYGKTTDSIETIVKNIKSKS